MARNSRKAVPEAMDSLERYLIDKDIGIIKLLDPPFEKSDLEPGYIKSYLDENGDFRKINYNFRVYPNDISNYILSLKIAINNRLSLYDIVYAEYFEKRKCTHEHIYLRKCRI